MLLLGYLQLFFFRSGKFPNPSDSEKAMNSDSAESPNPPSPTPQGGQDKDQFKTKVYCSPISDHLV